jgi:hypothetical protein
MSKKKNTLKDLDEFLKQQATSFVAPPRLSENIPDRQVDPATPVLQESPIMKEHTTLTFDKIADDLMSLARTEGPKFREKFCQLILETIGKQTSQSPEDKMLINTALYLRNPTNWKEVIRSYWKNR